MTGHPLRREQIEEAIEGLINLLDLTDSDPDLEPDDDDRCMAGDDMPAYAFRGDGRPGDPDDSECSGDELERGRAY